MRVEDRSKSSLGGRGRPHCLHTIGIVFVGCVREVTLIAG